MKINKTTDLVEDPSLEKDTVLESHLEEETSPKNKDIETLKDEEDLSPDERVARWKQLYSKIYLSVYDEQEFVWRKLKRREYTEILDTTPDEGIDDVVEYRQYMTIKTCVLSPNMNDQTFLNDLLDDYPGLLTSLSAEILKKSGFSKPLTIEI